MKKLLVTVLFAVTALSAIGPEKCMMCHKPGNKNPDIRGISIAAFTKAIHEYQNGTRTNAIMKNWAKKLSDADIATLGAHFSAQSK